MNKGILSVRCPVDNSKNALSDEIICKNPGCGEDLSALGRLTELPYAYFNEGLNLAREGKFQEALHKLAVAAELKKDYSRPYMLMGKIYAQKGMYPEAVECWEKVLALSPVDGRAQKAIDRAREIMDERVPIEEKGGDVASEIVQREEVPRLAVSPHSRLGLSAVHFAILGILLLCLSGLQWKVFDTQNRNISVLRDNLMRLEEKMNTYANSLPGEVQNLQNAIQQNMRLVETSTAAIHEKLASIEALNGMQWNHDGSGVTSFTPAQPLTEEQSSGTDSEDGRNQKPEHATVPQHTISLPNETGEFEYTIAKGDTLWSIAQRFLSSPERCGELITANANRMPAGPQKLTIGQKIIIPKNR